MTDNPSSPVLPVSDVAAASSPPVAENAAAPAALLATVPAAPRLVNVNSVNWANVLDFVHVFRGFRLAINPAKLGIALISLLMIYTAGRIFDAAWGPQVYKGELAEFTVQPESVNASLHASKVAGRANDLDALLRESTDLTSDQRDTIKNHPREAYGILKKAYRDKFLKDVADAADSRSLRQQLSAADSAESPFARSQTPAQQEQSDRQSAASDLAKKTNTLRDTVGEGIFDAFVHYETEQFGRMVENTLTLIRIVPVQQPASDFAQDAPPSLAVSQSLATTESAYWWRSDTIAGCIANMTITAPHWLFTGTAPAEWQPENAGWTGWIKMILYRGLYLVSVLVLVVFSLLLLAIAGASIARLSALELAGIERAPLKDVFIFAFRRLWVFIKAPIMPLAILLGIGLLMTLLGFLGAIPWIGPIILGAIFFVFLGIAFVLTLLLLGILGGYNLLFPTIAVEGADAFDAMSRSFAYVYARPWRLLWYSVLALLYGVITFIFVSFAVYLVLLLAHTFAGWGVNFFGMHNGVYSGISELDTIWPAPQFLHLILNVNPLNWGAMGWGEFFGALFLHFWVYLLITGIAAYVISYYFSSHTIIYLLLRRSVDGQNLRDIYMDEKPAPGNT